MWNKGVKANFKVLSWDLPGRYEENYKNFSLSQNSPYLNLYLYGVIEGLSLLIYKLSTRFHT
jgi:hypothetical protein